MPELDLSRPLRIHVVGAGGAGMSAIATVLVAMGHQVSGSDLKDSSALERLRSLGVDVAVGHDASHLRGAELVAVSTAVPSRPIPRSSSRQRHRASRCCAGPRCWPPSPRPAARWRWPEPTARRPRRRCSRSSSSRPACGRRSSSAATSPSSAAGRRGATANGWSWRPTRATARSSISTHGSAVVTSVEADHLDHYGSLAAMEAAFAQFLAGAPDARVVCADDPGAARLGRQAQALSYGTSPDADYRMVELTTGRGGSRFAVDHAGVRLGEIRLPVPGTAQRPQRLRCAGHGPGHRGAVRGGRAGPRPATAGWPGVSSSAGNGTGSPTSMTTPTCPARSEPPSPPARSGGLAPGRRRVPTPPLLADGVALAGVRGRLRRRRRGRRHRRLRRR